jgi:hypothetical protein
MADPFGFNFTTGGSGTQPDNNRFARLSDIQRGMRQQVPNNPFRPASSMYSQGTNPNLSTVNGPSVTPRTTRFFSGLGGMRRAQQQQTRSHPSPNASTTHLRTQAQPMPMSYSPIAPPTGWDTEADGLHVPEAAVLPDSMPINHRTNTSETHSSNHSNNSTSNTSNLSSTRASDSTARRHRKHRRRHRHHHQQGWTRRHRSGTPPASQSRTHFLHKQPKGDNAALSVFVSALFLAATLATYLAIALSVKGLGQELHILFGLTLGGGAIFLAYSLFRLYRSRRRQARRAARRAVREKRQAESNFAPTVPIRVHMAVDEELAVAEPVHETPVAAAAEPATTVPPPAYGLWRSSVKVNPELLFWQRVDGPARKINVRQAAAATTAGNSTGERQGPRPPSYISDDGVSYVIGAQPRSTVNVRRPPEENHPAYRR